jgi:hypothetical protein
VRRPTGILAGTTAAIAAALALAGCGATGESRGFGTFTDCAKIGRPVVTNDPAGDQRASKGAEVAAEPKGDLLALRVAKSDDELCAEFTADAPILPYAAFVLTMRPQAAETPVVQLQASVLAGQKPEALLDSVGNGRSFRKVEAKVGIRGKRLTVLVAREVFDQQDVGALFESFRFQARSAVAAEDEARLTDCMPVCE